MAWTQAAIDAGLQTRITPHQAVQSLFNQGLLVNAAPDGPVNHDPEIDGLPGGRGGGELHAHLRGASSLNQREKLQARSGYRSSFLPNEPWHLPWRRLNANLSYPQRLRPPDRRPLTAAAHVRGAP